MKKLLIVIVLLVAVAAVADITVLSSAATVDTVFISRDASGNIMAMVCGHAALGDGSRAASACSNVPLSGAAKTSVGNFLDGAALTAYKNAVGL